jgi:cytochrome c-type biogenesis protein CcsB
MQALFYIIATACYLIGTVGYLIYLLCNLALTHWLSWCALLVGALCHGAAIVLQSLNLGHLAVTNSQEALSFFTWLLICTYLIVQLRLNLRILGSFVSPLAVVFMIIASMIQSHTVPKTEIFQSAWVVFHVTTLFLANALFAMAFSAGIMYLLQERQLKRKHFGFLYRRLPSLDRLDEINFFCLIIGFPLMTAGLLAGFVYASNVWHTLWRWDPKEIFALVTWFIYAILLHERLAVGWRGRRAAWLAIFGFSAVLITFLGVNLVLKGHHTLFVM